MAGEKAEIATLPQTLQVPSPASLEGQGRLRCSHRYQQPGEAAGVHQARGCPTAMPARNNINREILKHVYKICVYAHIYSINIYKSYRLQTLRI